MQAPSPRIPKGGLGKTSDRFGPLAWKKAGLPAATEVVPGPVYDPITGKIVLVPSYVPSTGKVVMSEASIPWWNRTRPDAVAASASPVRTIPRKRKFPSWNDQDVRPPECYMEGIQMAKNKATVGRILPHLQERWVSTQAGDSVTIRILREYAADGKAVHVLERRGGVPPKDWVARIDPVTFEPMWWVPPGSASNIQQDTKEDIKKMDNAETAAMEKQERDGVWFERERYVTHAYIRDLTKVPRFWIDTPTFRFDSHADNPGWMLSCKQRHYNGRAGKLVIKLVHESDQVRSVVQIRPSNHYLHKVVATEEDFIEVFADGDFHLETSVIARQTHQPLNAYSSERLIRELNARGIELTTDMSAVPTIDSLSDEDLLAELRRRSEARLDGWRPRRKTLDLTNVINLEEIRQNLPVLDEAKLARILAA